MRFHHYPVIGMILPSVHDGEKAMPLLSGLRVPCGASLFQNFPFRNKFDQGVHGVAFQPNESIQSPFHLTLRIDVLDRLQDKLILQTLHQKKAEVVPIEDIHLANPAKEVDPAREVSHPLKNPEHENEWTTKSKVYLF